MGCSSSREARGGVASSVSSAPAERWQGPRPRSVTRAASALNSLGMCRGGHDGVRVYSYTMLPSGEEATKGAGDPAPAAAEEALPGGGGAAAEKEWAHDALSKPAAAVTGLEDAASPAAPWTAQWSAQPAPPEQPPATQATCDVDMGSPAGRDIPEVTGFVRARVDEFHEKMEKKREAAAVAEEAPGFIGDGDDGGATAPRLRLPPRAGKPVVLYFTSLRGVRRTFEDCRAVRAILRCYGVRLDERDVSMHAAFKSELRGLLGGAGGEGAAALPRVFVGGRRDLGGAEELRALHESGELARALARCDAAPAAGRPGHAGACAGCGEARFVPCGACHGSCKVFVGDEGCRFAGFFRQCPDCNENGLIRCPVCCY